MTNTLRLLAVFTALLLPLQATAAGDEEIERELDAYWASVQQYLGAGDFDRVVSTYHPEAVLVSESLGTSYPITRALERWKPGILDTQAGKAMSKVEFRITRRMYSDTTAFEQGMFHFRSGPTDADADPAEMEEAWVHFEALLLKSDTWTMIMERQKHPATVAEWEAAADAGGSGDFK